MGRLLEQLADADLHSVVQFCYDGGSTPGASRQVLIEDIVETRDGLGYIIFGRDLTLPLGVDGKGQYRQYKNELAYSISVVRESPTRYETQRISFMNVQQAVANKICELSADTLADVYRQLYCDEEKTSVVFDEETGDFEIETEIESKSSFGSIVCHEGDCKFNIMNEDGACIKVGIQEDKPNVHVDGQPVTPTEFAEILADHLDI